MELNIATAFADTEAENIVSRVEEVRETILSADVVEKIKGTAFLLQCYPVMLKASDSETVGFVPSIRKETAGFYSLRKVTGKKGSSRQALNNAATAILEKVRSGELTADKLTDEDKTVLAKYSGTGGDIEGEDGLKGSPYEYYTPKPVVEGMWDVMAELGFSGGKILDPCAGTGIFGALSPKNCVVDSVELSEVSGTICKLVNDGPGFHTTVCPFEKFAASTPDEAYDAIVTNVPFGNEEARGDNYKHDEKYQKESLDNYFILRSLEKLRPGGIAAFISAPRSVSGKEPKQMRMRMAASKMAEFIGAYRLPEGTFASANTNTVTDVLFFRKFSAKAAEKIEELAAQKSEVLSDSNVIWNPFIEGDYFKSDEGRKYVFGEVVTEKNRFGDTVETVKAKDGKVDPSYIRELMKLKRLPPSRIDWKMLNEEPTEPIVYNEGDIVYQAGRPMVMRNGVWETMATSSKDEKLDADIAKLATPLQAVMNKVDFLSAVKTIEAMNNVSRAMDIPEWLRMLSAEMVKINAKDCPKMWNKGIVGMAVKQVLAERSGQIGVNFLEEYPKLSEEMRKAGVTDADRRRTGGVLSEAMMQVRLHYNKKTGYADFWMGKGEVEVKNSFADDVLNTPQGKLSAYMYQNKTREIPVDKLKEIYGADFDIMASDDWCVSPDGTTAVKANDYYIGNYGEFIRKTDEAIANAKDPSIKQKLIRQKTVAAERVTKKDPSRLTFTLLSPIVSAEDRVTFLRQFLSKSADVKPMSDGTMQIEINPGLTEAGPNHQKLCRRIQEYVNKGTISTRGIFYEDETTGQKDFITPRQELEELVVSLNAQFDSWVHANPSVMASIDAMLNSPDKVEFNAPKEDSEIGEIPGMNKKTPDGKPFKLHSYQAAFVNQMGRSFSGINGFGVGLGKTYTALASVQHVQAIGAKKKTIFIVPKSVLANWRDESQRAYESTADCLYVGFRDSKVDPSKFDEDLHMIKNNRHSKIFMTYEAFGRIKLREETITQYGESLGADDEQYSGDASNLKSEAVKSGSRLQKYLDCITSDRSKRKTGAPYLEELGVDSIVIDEAHFLKNSVQKGKFKSAKYLSLPNAVACAVDAQAKAWYIRGQSPLKDGVLLLTATPITNSPLEIYSMMTLAVGRDRINNECGCHGAAGFLNMFCRKQTESYEKVDGAYDSKEAFVGLNNVEMLRDSINKAMTIKSAADVGGTLKVPESQVNAEGIALPDETRAMLRRYQKAYTYAGWLMKEDVDAEDMDDEEGTYRAAYDAIKAKFNEPDELIHHPLSLISKMDKMIVDPEQDDIATYYDFAPEDVAKAEAVCKAFNAKKFKEDRNRPGPKTKSTCILRSDKVIKGNSEDDEDDKVVYEIRVEADIVSGNRICLDSVDMKHQDTLEELARKNGLELNVRATGKLAALVENVKREMAHPRGLIKDEKGEPKLSKIVKQIVFCDSLAIHNKIRILLSKQCGIPYSKIAFISAPRVPDPISLQDVADKFNADGEENGYQLIIGNEKAEVGINLQKGTQAIHHLTIGWTPDSIEQRNGRGVRQGNVTESVTVYYYDADGTFDKIRRSMVNRKDEWISSVIHANGGNTVNVYGGMSDEEMDMLITTNGDEEAMRKAKEELDHKDRERRAKSIRDRQTINIETYVKQTAFVRENESPKKMLLALAVRCFGYYNVLEKLKADIKFYEDEMAKKGTASKTATDKYKKASERINAAQAQYDAARMKLVDSGIFRSYGGKDEKSPEEVFGFYSDTKPANFAKKIDNYYGYYSLYPRDGDTYIRKEWDEAVSIAKSMAQAAGAKFIELSEEDGAYPKSIGMALEEGNAKIIDGVFFVKGAFFRERGELFMVTLESDRELASYISPDTGEKFTRYVSRINVSNDDMIFKGANGYDEALKEAAAIEDAVVENRASYKYLDFYSKYNPDVTQYRNGTRVVAWKVDEYQLPAPNFPYVIDFGEDDPVLSAIAEEQKSVVLNVEIKESDWGRSYAYFYTDPSVEVERRMVISEDDVFLAAVDWAVSHGMKIGPTFTKMSTYRMFEFYEERMDMDAIVKAAEGGATAEEAEQLGIAEAQRQLSFVDWGKFGERDIRRTFGITVASSIEKGVIAVKERIAEEKRKRDDENAQVVSVEEDSPYCWVGGNTYYVKNTLKAIDKANGGPARWNGAVKCWLILRKSYDELVSQLGDDAEGLIVYPYSKYKMFDSRRNA